MKSKRPRAMFQTIKSKSECCITKQYTSFAYTPKFSTGIKNSIIIKDKEQFHKMMEQLRK